MSHPTPETDPVPATSATVADEAETPRKPETPQRPREYGGPKGLEPTRYGDWERKGRCVDF